MNMFMWEGFDIVLDWQQLVQDYMQPLKLMDITHIVSSSLAMSCHKFTLCTFPIDHVVHKNIYTLR